ncbi:MAG TPA: SIMPL domain-containing protein [Thermomicrobiales bacterium]|nr:SIMPL domain-containing protein [Thermomicrobiales bacterium]
MATYWSRLVVVLLLVVSVISAACGTGDSGTSDDGDVRAVTVTGEGRVSRAPDIVRMTLGVDISRPELGGAQSLAAETMTAVTAMLQERGVAGDDIQTETYAIYLDRDDSKSSQPVAGYHVVHTVTATVRDVAQAGEILTAAIDAGANNVQGISFAREDDAAAIAEARALAVADARAKAEDLARLADVELGPVITLSESVTGSSPYRDAGESAGGGVVPISPGQAVVGVSVTIEWELTGD